MYGFFLRHYEDVTKIGTTKIIISIIVVLLFLHRISSSCRYGRVIETYLKLGLKGSAAGN